MNTQKYTADAADVIDKVSNVIETIDFLSNEDLKALANYFSSRNKDACDLICAKRNELRTCFSELCEATINNTEVILKSNDNHDHE